MRITVVASGHAAAKSGGIYSGDVIVVIAGKSTLELGYVACGCRGSMFSG